jgi:septum formation protein
MENFKKTGREKMGKKLILASTSPRRHQILKQFGLKYDFIRPRLDEEKAKKAFKTNNPLKVACGLSLAKAASVVHKVKKGIILGSDTIVVLKGKVIGKPSSREDAFRILRSLSLNRHCVVTAIAFIDAETGKTLVTYDESFVTFKKLTAKWIRNYVETGSVMDKAGAYAVQENSDPFIRKIEGSYYNVVGLPIEKVKKILAGWEKL